jgi:hypothetical protein
MLSGFSDKSKQGVTVGNNLTGFSSKLTSQHKYEDFNSLVSQLSDKNSSYQKSMAIAQILKNEYGVTGDNYTQLEKSIQANIPYWKQQTELAQQKKKQDEYNKLNILEKGGRLVSGIADSIGSAVGSTVNTVGDVIAGVPVALSGDNNLKSAWSQQIQKDFGKSIPGAAYSTAQKVGNELAGYAYTLSKAPEAIKLQNEIKKAQQEGNKEKEAYYTKKYAEYDKESAQQVKDAYKYLSESKTVTGDIGSFQTPETITAKNFNWQPVIGATTEIAPYLMGNIGSRGQNALFQGTTGFAGNLASQAISGQPINLEQAIQTATAQGAFGLLGKGNTETKPKAANLMSDVVKKGDVEQFLPKKIGVSGEPSVSKLGVKVTTPLKAGIEQISSTDKIGVKIGRKMTDSEYNQKFTALEKAYNKAIKQAEKVDTSKNKILAQKVETKFEKAVNDLNDEYTQTIYDTTKSSMGKEKISTTKQTGGTKIVGGETTTQPTIETPKATTQVTKPVETKPAAATTTTPKTGKVASGPAIQARAKAIENGLNEDFSDVATYTKRSVKEEVAKIIDKAETNYDDVYKMAIGAKKSANQIENSAAYHYVMNKAGAEGDFDTQRLLSMSKRNIEVSMAGQKLGAEAYLANPNDPAKAMADITKIREKLAAKRTNTNIKKAVSADVEKISKSIKPPSKQTWGSFVESLRCNG